MKTKIFTSCEEASHRIDKAQYGEASFWEKLSYKIHTLYCKFCRAYSKKNKKLSAILKNEKVTALSTEQKLKIKEKLSKEVVNP